MILFLHHRYRTTGGEEHAVRELMWLVRERLGEDVELVERASERISARTAATGLLAGGLHPEQVARAVRRTRARIVHAHNLHPTFGWRALAAARGAGARVVLHLHQYRLVCATGVCFRDGADCTRCHGRDTTPGIVHNCRGSRAEALAYGAGLSAWQRRVSEQVDAFVVPSRFAAARLRELGAPVHDPCVVPHVIRAFAPGPTGDRSGPALIASRLAAEKGVEIAIEACRRAGVELVIAGDGPLRGTLERQASGSAIGTRSGVRFVGRVDATELGRLRAEAALAVVPSRSAETFGLAAAEAIAAGLPVAATSVGALPELVPARWLAAPGDAAALASVIESVRGGRDGDLDADIEAAITRCRAVTSPDAVAPALRAAYGRAELGATAA